MHPIEKVEELYQKLLKEKDDTIAYLRDEIKRLRGEQLVNDSMRQ